MALSNFSRAAILNWIKGSTFPAAPTAVYLALFSDAVQPDGSGTEVTATITGGNRPAVLFGAIQSNRIIKNDPAITVTASASGNANIVSAAIYVVPTPGTGNPIVLGTLAAPIPVVAGQSVQIPFEALSVILDEPC
jgi:hypothetical protein